MAAPLDRVANLWRLLQNDRLSPAALRALREKRLRALVRHAYDKVPFYAKRLRDAGLTPQDIHSLDDVRLLPITTKADLKQAGLEAIVAPWFDPKCCRMTRTGGTSGNQFDVYHSQRENRIMRQVRFRAMHRVGLRPWDRLGVLGLEAREYRPLYQRLGLYRSTPISTRLPIEEQTRILRQFQPTVLRFWPSDLWAVLHALDTRLSDIVHPRFLVFSAEVLDGALRRRIAEDLNVEVFNFYIAAEFGEIASECPKHQGLHVNADQLIVECLREDGQPAAPGENGAVVITSLFGYTMPFIRYPLGDVSAVLDRSCSCGSTLPLIQAPLGRQEDLVRLPSGQVLSVIGLGLTVDDVDAIDRYRFIQEAPDRMTLLLVLRQAMSEAQLATLRADLLAYLREPLALDIQVVNSIEEEKHKFRKFISRLAHDHSPDASVQGAVSSGSRTQA